MCSSLFVTIVVLLSRASILLNEGSLKFPCFDDDFAVLFLTLFPGALAPPGPLAGPVHAPCSGGGGPSRDEIRLRVVVVQRDADPGGQARGLGRCCVGRPHRNSAWAVTAAPARGGEVAFGFPLGWLAGWSRPCAASPVRGGPRPRAPRASCHLPSFLPQGASKGRKPHNG
jgi:hypothetical protein